MALLPYTAVSALPPAHEHIAMRNFSQHVIEVQKRAHTQAACYARHEVHHKEREHNAHTYTSSAVPYWRRTYLCTCIRPVHSKQVALLWTVLLLLLQHLSTGFGNNTAK